jgi:nucleotide-binding universal stress UspA family protein
MANLIIVPHDLTAIGDAALRYADFLAKHRGAEINVLHIVSDKSKSAAAMKALEESIEKYKSKETTDVLINPIIRVGSIFEDIGGIAEELEARLVVMGTHGVKGMQKLFGSYAIKVVTSTSVPFLVVQETSPPEKISNIVVPIDLTKESLQIINPAAEIALTHGAKVHILAEKQTDPRLSQQIKVRISLVKKEYQERNVDSEIHLMEPSGSFYKKIRAFAKEKNAELIAMAYYSESLFPQFDGFAQSLLTNDERIPCLIVNSKLLSKLYY